MSLILSHFKAASGAVLVETREERRLMVEAISEIEAEFAKRNDELVKKGRDPEKDPAYVVEVCVIAAPGGALMNALTGKPVEGSAPGLDNAYNWAVSGSGRVLIVHDWHVIANNQGQWRKLIDVLPRLRSPTAGDGRNPGYGSMVVFVAPSWELSHQNPLRGAIPTVEFHTPDRKAMEHVVDGLGLKKKKKEEMDQIVDALCGLAADTAEQAASECLAEKGKLDVDYLRNARRKMIREAGLEIWDATSEIGGLSGLRDFTETEVLTFFREDQLAVRRLLSAGLPGTGKSFFARWIAGRLNCECCRLSIPSLKAGTVGSSEANLRRALRTVDSLGKDSPVVMVIDEIDTIAREGLDGGTSSGMFAELLTWLQESKSQVLVVATLNRLDKLDAALESRFAARFFFELPTKAEREAVAKIHYQRLKCSSGWVETAEYTDGFSSREIAEQVCTSVARRTNRNPTPEAIKAVCKSITPASKTQVEQLEQMRKAASSLRRANDPADSAQAAPTQRKIGRHLEVEVETVA